MFAVSPNDATTLRWLIIVCVLNYYHSLKRSAELKGGEVLCHLIVVCLKRIVYIVLVDCCVILHNSKVLSGCLIISVQI